MNRRVPIILFIICLLSISVGIYFWRQASAASWRSQVNLNNCEFVPQGTDCHTYSDQQSGLVNRYGVVAFIAGTVAVITLSSGTTYLIVSHKKSISK
ncbi:MAG TPA: hypothetical protein VIH90_04605 [Candidatus Saccharimonadales bacterium]